MTFYRPGGNAKRINAQQDTVYSDAIGGASGWLPVNEGDNVAVNISRASLAFVSAAQSTITTSPIAPEVQVLLEQKILGGDADAAARPIDQWQNLIVATSRRAQRAGWARLRIVNINNADGTGVVMDMQVTRTNNNMAPV